MAYGIAFHVEQNLPYPLADFAGNHRSMTDKPQKAPKMQPYEQDSWRAEVQSYYPEAFIQDDSTPSALRARALHRGSLVGFFLRSYSSGQGSGYVRIPEVSDGA